MVLPLRKHNLCLLGLLVIVSCTSVKDESKESLNKFNDPIIQQINEQKFNNWRSHLNNSLNNANPEYKAEALLAFASLRDHSGFQKIKEILLHDPQPFVRSTAAFSLGEIGGEEVIQLLNTALVAEKDNDVIKQILISLANIIQPDQLSLLTNFSPTETALKEGQCLSLVIVKKRYMTDLKITEVATNYATDPKEALNIRLLASEIISIADSSELIAQESSLRKLLSTEANTEIISSLILGLRKTRNDSNATIFEHHLKSPDWIVRMNSLYALSEINSGKYNHYFLTSLTDPSMRVVNAASEILKQKFNEFAASTLLSEARKATSWQAKLNLYEAAFLASRDLRILDELTTNYGGLTNDFAKAMCIQIISYDIAKYKFISNELMATKSPVIRTSCARSLTYLNLEKSFPPNLKGEFIGIYKKGIELGDPAVTTIFCRILYNPSLNYYKDINNTQFLDIARKKLEDKRDVTAMEPMETLASKIDNRTRKKFTPLQHKNPDWATIKSIDKNQKISINTTKGTITVRLWVEKAPVAVSNFLQLVSEHYYDSTTFFNVGINSFIQAGCKRGDGFGRLDYNLPYEASMTPYNSPMLFIAPFKNGYESTQWYISLNTVIVDSGIPIGIVETDISLLRSIEKGDTILTISLSNE
jgi:cyclophilin family peptidyl-prolyl cis-trans isomerase/HEAT repeat protein